MNFERAIGMTNPLEAGRIATLARILKFPALRCS